MVQNAQGGGVGRLPVSCTSELASHLAVAFIAGRRGETTPIMIRASGRKHHASDVKKDIDSMNTVYRSFLWILHRNIASVRLEGLFLEHKVSTQHNTLGRYLPKNDRIRRSDSQVLLHAFNNTPPPLPSTLFMLIRRPAAEQASHSAASIAP